MPVILFPAGGKMKTCLSAEEMKLCDSNTMQHYGVPSCVLMERAALEFVRSLHKEKADLSRVLVVCGSGNNGGGSRSNAGSGRSTRPAAPSGGGRGAGHGIF